MIASQFDEAASTDERDMHKLINSSHQDHGLFRLGSAQRVSSGVACHRSSQAAFSSSVAHRKCFFASSSKNANHSLSARKTSFPSSPLFYAAICLCLSSFNASKTLQSFSKRF